MKRIYITGSCGLLGSAIVKELSDKYELFGVDLININQQGCKTECFDLTNYELLRQNIIQVHPKILIHTAAAINVDRCEEDREYAYKLNVELTKKIVNICCEENIKLIYISTDAVYDGEKNGLYTEDDITNPINYYGETKLTGEDAVRTHPNNLILRTNIYGKNIQSKKSFGEWIVESLRENKELNMFTDIIFSPVLVNELAIIIDKCIERNLSGCYIACGTGSITKYDFGILTKEIFQISTGKINKSLSDDVDFKARRSKNMGMSNGKLCEELGIEISTPAESIEKFKKLYREEKENGN